MEFKRKKIGLVGAGHIGGNLALMAAQKGLGDVVLYDIVEGVPQGKALDIYEATPVEGYSVKITGTNDFADLEGSDVVIITAGRPRKPGMSRDDLLESNAKIMTNVAENIKKHAPNSVVIVISNPLDAMVYLCAKVTGFEPNRIIGMSGVLDASRFRAFISMETGVSVKDIRAFVLGGHGDQMVPLPRYSFVGGVPLPDFPGMNDDIIEKMVARTRQAGAEIVALLKTGSAFYAPAAGAISMAEAVLFDQKRVFTAAAYCNGEYGYKDMFIGLPSVLGGKGVERVLELKLNPAEKAALDKSAETVESLKNDLKKMGYL